MKVTDINTGLVLESENEEVAEQWRLNPERYVDMTALIEGKPPQKPVKSSKTTGTE